MLLTKGRVLSSSSRAVAQARPRCVTVRATAQPARQIAEEDASRRSMLMGVMSIGLTGLMADVARAEEEGERCLHAISLRRIASACNPIGA